MTVMIEVWAKQGGDWWTRALWDGDSGDSSSGVAEVEEDVFDTQLNGWEGHVRGGSSWKV